MTQIFLRGSFFPQSSQIFLHRITRSYRNILALRITHGFSRIFGRWPMADARNVLLLFCHADFADDADFSSWKFFVPQISQIFMESLVNRLVHSQGVSATTEQVASAKIRE